MLTEDMSARINSLSAEQRDHYRHAPADFCREVLQVEPLSWQETALEALARGKEPIIRRGIDTGKTWLQEVVKIWQEL